MGLGRIFRRTHAPVHSADPLDTFRDAMRTVQHATYPFQNGAAADHRSLEGLSAGLSTALRGLGAVLAHPGASPGAVATATRASEAVLQIKRGVLALASGADNRSAVERDALDLWVEASGELTVAGRWQTTWRDLTAELNTAWADVERPDVSARSAAASDTPADLIRQALAELEAGTTSEAAAASDRLRSIAAEFTGSSLTPRASRREGQAALAATLGPLVPSAIAATALMPTAAGALALGVATGTAAGLTGLVGAAGRAVRRNTRDAAMIDNRIAELAVLASDPALSLEQRRGLIEVVNALAPETSLAARSAARIPTGVTPTYNTSKVQIASAGAGLGRIAVGRPHATQLTDLIAREIDADMARLNELRTSAESRLEHLDAARTELEAAPRELA